MEAENLSSADDFVIVGFSDLPELQVPLFVAFLLIYLITLVGNLLIIATIYCTSHLHTPMYFFLTNLSFIDLCHTSVIFPQLLTNFFQEGIHVSLTECIVQVYFFTFMMTTEVLLLAIMAYDRYVAICNPLRYMIIMNKDKCIMMALGIWFAGVIISLPHTVLITRVSFCKSHTINHFFCDYSALLKMSCTSTQLIETLTYVFGVMVTLMSFTLIIISYIRITSSIVKMKSRGGRQKAISTCSSHLIVVFLFYLSICSSYMRPTSTMSMKENKVMSLSYIVVTPLCNPIIYTLKNTDFKNALIKTKMRAYRTVKNIAFILMLVEITLFSIEYPGAQIEYQQGIM